MSNVISDSVSKLSAITDRTPIDWEAFDDVLKGLENINACDVQNEETILTNHKRVWAFEKGMVTNYGVVWRF